MDNFLSKVKRLLEKLSSKPRIGGFQISDSVIQYVLIGDKPQAFSLRLPVGVLREGKVQNPSELLKSLNQLHKMIEPEKASLRIPVVVSLPAAVVYTQSFNVPNVGQEKVEEVVGLNLQMISPMPKDQAYMSWQILSETTENYELLGAFTERGNVDKLKDVLEAANFSPVAFEFPSLALARLINQTASVTPFPVLVFHISSEGLNLFILRNGLVYFDYFHSWRSVQGESREISRAVFNEVVTQEVQKVINFAQSKYNENLEHVFLIAPGFEVEMQQFLEKRFGLKVVPLRLRSWPLAPGWYIALGSALRGAIDRSQDRFISLAPLSSVKLFYQEQALIFIRLWRNVIAGVLAVLLIAFGSSAYFLVNQTKSLNRQLGLFSDRSKQQEYAELGKKAKEFNNLVASIKTARGPAGQLYPFLVRLSKLASNHRVILENLGVTSLGEPINLTARSPDYETIVRFKDAMVADPSFYEVNLIVSKITALEDNTVLFNIVFRYRGA